MIFTPRRRLVRALPVLAVIAAAGACSDSGESDDSLDPLTVPETVPPAVTTAPPMTTQAPATTQAPTTTLPPTTAPPATTAAPTPPPTPAPTPPPPTEPPTTPSPTEAPSEGLALDSTGVGVASFGDDPESAIAAVTGVLGEPTEDSGWVDPFTISACPGNEYRRVTWGAFSLQFSDSTAIADGRRHLFGYEYGLVGTTDVQPPGLQTPAGISIGSTVADLKQAYPGVAVFAGEEGLSQSGFEVEENRLGGFITDATDAGIVVVIIGGLVCGG